jgi:hypothetical protein
MMIGEFEYEGENFVLPDLGSFLSYKSIEFYERRFITDQYGLG